jgi:hypothetical protein
MAPEVMTAEKRARGIALCRGEAERWRREAANVRNRAALPQLDVVACAMLLRSAARCDDEAAYWKAGAQEHETQDAPTPPKPDPIHPCSTRTPPCPPFRLPCLPLSWP